MIVAVTFVSCKSLSWRSYRETPFFLVKDDQILYKFPSQIGSGGLFDSVDAVAFRDINDDGKDDIIIIINYIMGAGPQGVIPRPAVSRAVFFFTLLTTLDSTGATGYLKIKSHCGKFNCAPGAGRHEASGYIFEKLILYATYLRLGTCWIGGTFNRGEFAAAMQVRENEIFPVISSIGYPAGKRRAAENILRKMGKSDQRKSWKKLFF